MIGTLFPWLLALWAKASVLLMLALLADRLLRRAPAHTRHAMWTAVFVALLALPILSGVLPTLPVPGLTLPLAASTVEAGAGGSTADNDRLGDPTGIDGAERDENGPRGAAPATMSGRSHVIESIPPNEHVAESRAIGYGAMIAERLVESAPTSVIAAWAVGALVALTLLLVSFRRAAGLMARAGDLLDIGWRTDLFHARALLGMRKPVRLRASAQIGTPMAGGLWHSVVLVPDIARRWSSERRRFVLLHELVHLDRRDPVRHLVARLALVLHWPNPLAWLAAHRAISAREQACDEHVLSLGARPSSYARELLELNDLLHSPNTARIAALPMIQRSQMEKRVMNILRENRRPLRRPAVIVLVAVASIATLSVAAAAPQKPKPVVKVLPAVSVKLAPVAPVVKVSLAPQVVAPVAPVVAVSLAPSVVEVAPLPVISEITRESACSPEGTGNFSGSMSMTGDTDDGYTVYERVGTQDGNFVFVQRLDDKIVCMRTEGDVEINRETGEVVSIGRDGVVVWEARYGDVVQHLEVRAGDDYTWSVDGAERQYDADARAWYESMREVVAGQWAISTLRGRAASKRGEMASIRGAAASVRGQMASARGQVASLRGQIATTNGQGATMRGRMATVRGEVATMRGSAASERGSIASLRARQRQADSEERAEINRRIEQHETRIAEIEREIEKFDVKARVEALEQELGAMELKGQVAAVEARISDYDLQGKLAVLEDDLEALELDSNIARIEAEIDAMDVDDRVKELEARVGPARARLERLIERMR